MNIYASLCKCGNYTAIVSSTPPTKRNQQRLPITAKTGYQVVEIAYDDAKPRFGPCECGKPECAGQLPLFDTEST